MFFGASWLAIAAWSLIYIPLCLRSFIGEGAGGLFALMAIVLWLLGPAILMGILNLSLLRSPARRAATDLIAIGLLFVAICRLLFQVLPSPSGNSDLLLPTACLGVFLVSHGLLRTLRTAGSGGHSTREP